MRLWCAFGAQPSSCSVSQSRSKAPARPPTTGRAWRVARSAAGGWWPPTPAPAPWRLPAPATRSGTVSLLAPAASPPPTPPNGRQVAALPHLATVAPCRAQGLNPLHLACSCCRDLLNPTPLLDCSLHREPFFSSMKLRLAFLSVTATANKRTCRSWRGTCRRLPAWAKSTARADLGELGDVQILGVILGANLGQLGAQRVFLRSDVGELSVLLPQPLHDAFAVVVAIQLLQLAAERRHARLHVRAHSKFGTTCQLFSAMESVSCPFRMSSCSSLRHSG